jgi:hypothetical protein
LTVKSLALAGVKEAFSESSWKEAKFPTGISLILTNLESKDALPEITPHRTVKQALGSSCTPSLKGQK